MSDTTNAACPDPSLHRDEWIRADDVNRLVREIDVALNGEEGAAQQASLCDVAAQIEALSRAAKARAAPGEPSAEPTSEEILRKFVTSLTGYLGSVAYECPAQFVADTQQRAQEVLNRAAFAHPEAPTNEGIMGPYVRALLEAERKRCMDEADAFSRVAPGMGEDQWRDRFRQIEAALAAQPEARAAQTAVTEAMVSAALGFLVPVGSAPDPCTYERREGGPYHGTCYLDTNQMRAVLEAALSAHPGVRAAPTAEHHEGYFQ